MDRRLLVASLPVAAALVLAGCTQSAPPPDPRDAAITACRQMAARHTGLGTAGRVTDIVAVEGDEGWEGWEIAGRHEETEWFCSWKRRTTAGGTYVGTEIDTRPADEPTT